MANATDSFPNTHAPALMRLRALLALLFQLAMKPTCERTLDRLSGEADQLLASLIFKAAIRISGRDDLRDAYEPIVTWRGGRLRFSLRARSAHLHPHQRIMIACRRARALARYRTALGCRSRCSAKRRLVQGSNQSRIQRAVAAGRRASTAPCAYRPARINAPP